MLESSLSTFPQALEPSLNVEPEFGNRFAYFEFPNPQGAQIIRHKFRVKTWELRWNLDPAKVPSTTQWPASFAPYLRSEKQAVIVDQRFDKLLAGNRAATRQPAGRPAQRARLGRPQSGLRSRRRLAPGQFDACLEHRRGHCSDYHGFCAALGRVMSQPTRVTYGINTFPKQSPSHCKLEAFLPPYGWVSFDVSETQKLSTAIRGDMRTRRTPNESA